MNPLLFVGSGVAGVLTVFFLITFYMDGIHLSPDKITVAPTGVIDEEEVCEVMKARSPNRSCKTVMFLGGLKPIKDPMTTVRAFTILHQKIPSSRLVIIGEGSCRAEIEGFVKASGLGGCIILKGLLSHRDALLELANSDALSISSLSEAGPIVAIEAMAMGVPVVSTRVGEMVELIKDGENGFLADGSTEIAQAMYAILSNPELSKKIAQNARLSVSNRTVSNQTDIFEELYARAIRR